MGSWLHRGPVGEPGGVHLVGLLREKETAYLGSLFLDPEDINRLKPNDPYMGRTAPLTSKRCI